MRQSFPPGAAGFSLVEMAIVLAIVGLLLGGLLPTLSAQMEARQIDETRKQLADIKEALTGYALINGRLPCPANGTLSSGAESTSGSGSSVACTLTLGVLPWTTLGVDETDAWGRRFTYRVTSTYADGTDGTGSASCSITTGVSFQLCSTANLNVKATSGGADVVTDIPAIVVSHGKNMLGSYPASGGAQLAGASGDEAENADDDNIFVGKDQIQNGYDDMVVWLSPNSLVNRMVTAGKLP